MISIQSSSLNTYIEVTAVHIVTDADNISKDMADILI